MITSLTNPKVKLVRSLTRKKERYAARQFTVEGVRLVEEALNARATPTLVLYTPALENDPRGGLLLKRARGEDRSPRS
jgi:tRNA G18 (ribose-2'-O)-methylase SpoU